MQVNVIDCLQRVSKYETDQCGYLYGPPFVFETSKLVVLIPPKVGHSFIEKIFSELTATMPSKYHKLISHYWYTPRLQTKLTFEENINNSLKNIWRNIHNDECKNFVATFFCDVSYKKILMYRDPLTRLLSGYIEKCTTAHRPYNTHKFKEKPCNEYLLSVGIETEYLPYSPRFVHTNFSANNTFNTFIKWLLFSYGENNDNLKLFVDAHFRNFHQFADLSYFHKNWNVLSLADINSWDYIVESILMNSSLFQYWYDIRDKYFDYNDRKKITPHETQSSSKVMIYYHDIDTLYLGLRYTWKDYYIFEWNLPEWICDILFSDNNNAYIISDFIRQNFQNKTQLWPSCVSLNNYTQNCIGEYLKIVPNIEGWFNFEVIIPILEKINTIQQHTDGNILEIGVYHGKSFISMLCLLKNNEMAVAVDVFEDQQYNYDSAGMGNSTILNRNINTVFKNTKNIYSKINMIKADSSTLKSKHYLDYVSNNLKYRIISIDGCHTKYATLNDLNNAIKIVSQNGVIMVDDYLNNEWPGVKAGVDSFLEKHNNYRVFYLNANKFILCHTNNYETYINVFGDMANNIAIHHESRSWIDQVWKK